MNVQVMGCSHHKSASSFRERIAFAANEIPAFLADFYEKFPQGEALLLSTCNRTELYVMGSHPDLLPSASEMLGLFADHRDVNCEELEETLFHLKDEQAVQHLFKVSCSLDSMVVGESQIISQIKQAYEIAVDMRSSTPSIHRLFDFAIRVAKRVSSETDIHKNRVSVPSIAINVLARRIFERLDNKNVLVLGAGEMAEETLTYLKSSGATNITVANRTLESAHRLADRFGGKTIAWSNIMPEIARADLVISTTGAKKVIVTLERFRGAMAQRKLKPLFILDLAIPRDFDESIDKEEDVYLYSLDDLQRECERNTKNRKSQWPKAEAIISEETTAFFQDARRRASGSTIALLKKQANLLRDDELKRLMNRLDSVSDADRKEIEIAFNRIVNKILHPPLESIREESKSVDVTESGGLLEAMKQLFKLE